MPNSPSILNYYIGKGVVSIKLAGETEYRDVGNMPIFEWTPEIEEKEHYSSRFGIKSLDRTFILSKGGTVRLVFEEYTAENLQLALTGDLDTNTDGDPIIDILSADSLSGAVRFVGANDVGPKITFELFNVQFKPNGTLGLITEEEGQIEMEGKALINDEGKFGSCIITEEEPTA